MLNFLVGVVVGAFVGWVIPAPAWAIQLIDKYRNRKE